MDQRLQDIERELNGGSEDGPARKILADRTTPLVPEAPTEPAAESPPASEPEPDAEAEPEGSVHALPRPRAGSVAWPRVGGSRKAGTDPAVDDRERRLPGDPHERASAIIASAHAEAARIVGDAAATMASLSREIEELTLLRDELRDSLGDEFAPAPAVPSSTLFEGELAIHAGPFPDIAALGDFERAMGALQAVGEARVRGFEGDNAVLDVTLVAPVRLIAEMERGLPWDFLLERSERDAIFVRLLEAE
jgi:hypothetical protein